MGERGEVAAWREGSEGGSGAGEGAGAAAAAAVALVWATAGVGGLVVAWDEA